MKLLALIPASILAFSPIALADHHGGKKEAPAKKIDVKVEIECNDQMQFNKKELEVKAGQNIELTLKNVGKLPKVAMGHNLVILKAGEQVPAFAMKAMQAKATDYIPADKETKSKILAYTKLLGPGEKDTIIFTAPAAGTYEYLCTFPGHFGVMKGKMIVK